MTTRRGLLAAYATALAAPALAQDVYPDRPIRLIIPLPPGGGADLIGRLVANAIGRVLGQTLVVDNRGGAGGTIGSRFVATSRPDGYTILLGYTASHGINPALTQVPYDPVTDFTPISFLATAPNALVTGPNFPANSVVDLVTIAKRRPESVRYASAGIASSPHLSALLFDQMAGTEMLHVPYRGNGPALVAVMSGEVDISFASLPSALALRANGQVKVLAVTSAQRSALLPDVPTVAETMPSFEIGQWYALYAPPGLPAPILSRLNQATHEALRDPDMAAQVQNEGFELRGTTPEELRDFTRADLEKWRRLAAATSLKIE
jgi:tripartite-type tricarboxylate transporter receptor subunit TctC